MEPMEPSLDPPLQGPYYQDLIAQGRLDTEPQGISEPSRLQICTAVSAIIHQGDIGYLTLRASVTIQVPCPKHAKLSEPNVKDIKVGYSPEREHSQLQHYLSDSMGAVQDQVTESDW